MVHLTCRAFGFFPRNISVAWFRDEEPMSRDILESGGVQTDGNRTYYTWETITVPQGEEQRVKCLVEHNGNHSTHLAPLGNTLVHQRSRWIVSVRVAVVLIIGFCVYCYIKKRKTVSATGRPGSHRLSYNTTVLSRDGFVQSRFFAMGYLDGQNFLNYDHKKGRAELWGQWAERLGAETWETVSKDLKETWMELRKLLAEILSLQEEKRGLHSLQETVGCEIREDSHPRGFRLLHFDGELLLSCYQEAHGCALPQSSARTLVMEMEKSWDTRGFLSKHYRAHMQGELCGRLRGYLESWTGFMERTGTDPGPGPSSAPILKPTIPTCPRSPSLSSGCVCALLAWC
ncbi:hypothetical protein Celaphus_00014467, partial [Cervus elaphus hippelaphus]